MLLSTKLMILVYKGAKSMKLSTRGRYGTRALEESGYSGSRVDPYVARVLAQKPVEVQRAVKGVFILGGTRF